MCTRILPYWMGGEIGPIITLEAAVHKIQGAFQLLTIGHEIRKQFRKLQMNFLPQGLTLRLL